MNLLNDGSQAVQDILRDLQLIKLVLLRLQLTDKVQHAPRMSRLHIDPLKHLSQQNVPGLLIVALEDNSSHKINKEASNSVGIPDQIKRKFDHLLLQLTLQRNYNILNSFKITISNFLELVTDN